MEMGNNERGNHRKRQKETRYSPWRMAGDLDDFIFSIFLLSISRVRYWTTSPIANNPLESQTIIQKMSFASSIFISAHSHLILSVRPQSSHPFEARSSKCEAREYLKGKYDKVKTIATTMPAQTKRQ